MDSLGTGRTLLKGWSGDRFVVPVSDVLFQGMELMEPDLVDMPRKPVVSCHSLEHLDNTSVGSRLSNWGVEMGAEKLVQTSLEIMKAVGSGDSKCNEFYVEKSFFSSQEPVLSTKRAWIEVLQSQIPICLVHGCKKDLSLLKEYHRKHKVCDVHSKAAVVTVNGVWQRFCQQCSRFHKLTEFDKGKRSCRKRLADHNERRRKPQLGSMLFKTDFLSWQCKKPNCLETTQMHRSVAPLKFGPSVPPQYCLDPMQTAVELSGSNSSYARSLLSAQSQSSLSSSEMDNPLIFEGYCHSSNLAFNPDSTRHDVAGVCLSFGTPRKQLLEDSASATLKLKNQANTVDLLQLSSHLQRVLQQQKCSALENALSCHPFSY